MQHIVYPDMSEKEKIFGGILTLGEFGWIAGFSLLGVVVALSCFGFLGAYCVILFIPFLAGGIMMAFYKVQGMPLLKYFRLKWKYMNSQKKYMNRRKGQVFTMSVPEEEVE